MFLAILFLTSAVPSLYSQTNALPPLSPPYGELPPTFWELHGTSVILAGLGAVFLVAMIVWQLLRSKPMVVVPPEVQARQALEALRGPPEDGRCLSHISQNLRNYFSAVFQLPAGELTTAEFNRALAGCEPVGTELATAVAVFLQECDARKFSPAPAVAPLEAANRALQLVAKAEQRRAQIQQPAETSTPAPRA